MVYDRSKVTELIKTSGRKLRALIKEDSYEKIKQSLPKDTMKKRTNREKNILKDNVVDLVSKVFSFCVFV